jgi:hypothetical protein
VPTRVGKSHGLVLMAPLAAVLQSAPSRVVAALWTRRNFTAKNFIGWDGWHRSLRFEARGNFLLKKSNRASNVSSSGEYGRIAPVDGGQTKRFKRASNRRIFWVMFTETALEGDGKGGGFRPIRPIRPNGPNGPIKPAKRARNV